jgi:hypothetical protein
VVRELQLSRPVNMPMRGWPAIYWNDATDSYERYSFTNVQSRVGDRDCRRSTRSATCARPRGSAHLPVR